MPLLSVPRAVEKESTVSHCQLIDYFAFIGSTLAVEKGTSHCQPIGHVAFIGFALVLRLEDHLTASIHG